MRFKVKATRKLDRNMTENDSVEMYLSSGNSVSVELLLERYHELWRECHTKQNANPEWFADWVSKVPKACCGKDLQTILDELGTPDYADWFVYSVRLHNAVNRKLSKPEIDLETARQMRIELG